MIARYSTRMASAMAWSSPRRSRSIRFSGPGFTLAGAATEESFHRAGRLECGLEVRDVALDSGLAGVGDRRTHTPRRPSRRRGGRTARRVELGVKLGEARAVGAARKDGPRPSRPGSKPLRARRVLRPADRLPNRRRSACRCDLGLRPTIQNRALRHPGTPARRRLLRCFAPMNCSTAPAG